MENIPLSEGAKILLNTIHKELFPVLNDLKQLLVDIQGLRINFPLYSKRLNIYSVKYQTIAKSFFTIVQKLETPDILFKDLSNKNPQDIASYFQFHEAMSKNINEGSKYVEIIDRTLDRKRQTIYNSWTIFLAALAIVISIILTSHEKVQYSPSTHFRNSFIYQQMH